MELRNWVVFITGEIILIGLYFLLNLFMNKNKTSLFSVSSIFRGILERSILFLGLLMDYSNIIMFFAAIKLGTRLDNEAKSVISNNYFLVGNLVSVGAVLIYLLISKS